MGQTDDTIEIQFECLTLDEAGVKADELRRGNSSTSRTTRTGPASARSPW